MDKDYLNNLEFEKLQELNNKLKKRLENKQVYNEQIEQARVMDSLKKQRKMNEIEEGKIYVEKYEDLLDYKDKERLDIKLSIQERAKIRDLRENNSLNVKSLQEMIDYELENKYKKEKEELDKK